MKKALLLVLLAAPAFGHRLDEYLQATIISVENNQLHASMRLIPGVAVSNQVIQSIDANSDGVISDAESHAYAERVLRDLSLSLNGQALTPKLLSVDTPPLTDMKEGTGEIHIEFTADLLPESGNRQLVFINHHLPAISVYLVNCLQPKDQGIEIAGQTRNRNQSSYQLDYSSPNTSSNMFVLGMRHIAEGTDHLLFLLALLLPAQSLIRILRIVTAFTIGHSLTLAAAAFGLVHVPSRPVEALIALSVLISAIHALRPIFPGREAFIAGFFGLIHGLAFAATLTQLGLTLWQRVANLLAFNLGIETTQIIVVLTALPLLLLLGRTRHYSLFRIPAALGTSCAAIFWLSAALA